MCKQWPCCSPVQDKFQFESVARINQLEDIQEKEGEKEKYGGSTIEVKRRKNNFGCSTSQMSSSTQQDP